MDRRSNKIYDMDLVLEKFVPKEFHETFSESQVCRKKIKEFISKLNCKLIETQRLFIFDNDNDDDDGRFITSKSHKYQKTKYAISKKSDILQGIISKAIRVRTY